MCKKAVLKREGIRFLLSLPVKHKNRVKNLLLQEVKIIALKQARMEENHIEKHKLQN